MRLRQSFLLMNIVTAINDWQQIRKNLPNETIGFVPTMGNLHAGHISLCTRAKRENAITVVSICESYAI